MRDDKSLYKCYGRKHESLGLQLAVWSGDGAG